MSSVQFNLLPDVKLEFIKAQRSKNLIFSVALIIALVSLGIFLIALVTVEGLQKKQLSNADNVVTADTQQLQNTNGLDQIITVQNQLQTLTTLQRSKHITSRLFAYLQQITPNTVSIGNLSLDNLPPSMQISGTADNQDSVNTFIDTLKFTTYTIGGQGSSRTAFPSVVESSFSISTGSVSYSLQVTFDPQLFSNSVSDTPKLTVPKLTTTRSALDDPNELFNGQSASIGNTGGQ